MHLCIIWLQLGTGGFEVFGRESRGPWDGPGRISWASCRPVRRADGLEGQRRIHSCVVIAREALTHSTIEKNIYIKERE